MKKSTLFLVAFMLLGLSFAKAQLVTIYDIPLKNFQNFGDIMMDFENTNPKIRITAFVPNDKRMPVRLKLELNGVPIDLGDLSPSSAGLVGNAYAYKIGTRTHIIRIDEKIKKCLYGFFDEQPDPIKEFNQKAQKGF